MHVTEPSGWDLDEDLTSKYEVLDVLGGGGMGRVLRARHRQLRQLVAIKLLAHDLRASEAVTRFLREARAVARIRGPHVAHVMDAGILRNGQPYIVMEYLQGQDLGRLIASRGRVPVEQAVGFILQTLEALAEAHALKIIHRDIKPANLFATRVAGGDTSIKILDFGLAKTAHAFDTLDPGVTERGAVLGTPSYMSPEQFVDAQDVDARADIWGVGATLFELLTGVPPFTGTNLPQVYTAVMHRPVPSLRSCAPELPEGLECVVAKCLMRERAERYLDVAEFAAALAPFADPSAHDQIQRIERIVRGVLDPADLSEAAPEQAALELASSSVSRASKQPGATPPPAASVRRPLRVWLSLSAVALLGLALGLYANRTPALPRTPDPPSVQQARAKPSAEPAAPKLTTEPHTSVPANSAADPLQATAINPSVSTPPIAAENVSRPTATKKQRPKVSQPTAKRAPNSDIYEQYP